MQVTVSAGRDAAPASVGGEPWLNITPQLAVKVAGAVVLMTIGLYYLATGREQRSLNRMILGALLAFGSLFLL